MQVLMSQLPRHAALVALWWGMYFASPDKLDPKVPFCEEGSTAGHDLAI